MILKKCDSCGYVSIAEFYVCPECNGERFSDREASDAKVIMSLQLNATAAPFPDVYYVNLVETEGARIFCRSERELSRGKSVSIISDGTGIVCS